jgi:hypothetical protein
LTIINVPLDEVSSGDRLSTTKVLRSPVVVASVFGLGSPGAPTQ